MIQKLTETRLLKIPESIIIFISYKQNKKNSQDKYLIYKRIFKAFVLKFEKAISKKEALHYLIAILPLSLADPKISIKTQLLFLNKL